MARAGMGAGTEAGKGAAAKTTLFPKSCLPCLLFLWRLLTTFRSLGVLAFSCLLTMAASEIATEAAKSTTKVDWKWE